MLKQGAAQGILRCIFIVLVPVALAAQTSRFEARPRIFVVAVHDSSLFTLCAPGGEQDCRASFTRGLPLPSCSWGNGFLQPTKTFAVIMQRRALNNRWQSEAWEPWSVLESREPKGEPRLLVEETGVAQWLHPGFDLVLHRDEAEGYYLNVSTDSPKVFVLWIMCR